MPSHDEMQAANDDSLCRDAGIALRLLHWFMESREEALVGLMGPGYRPDPLREDLMRVICLFFAERQVHPWSDYRRDFVPRWGEAAVEGALQVLRTAKLVVVDDHDLIRPTKRLISFYNTVMPEVLKVARHIVRDQVPVPSRDAL